VKNIVVVEEKGKGNLGNKRKGTTPLGGWDPFRQVGKVRRGRKGEKKRCWQRGYTQARKPSARVPTRLSSKGREKSSVEGPGEE